MDTKYVEKWFTDEQKAQRELQLFFLERLFKKGGGLVFKGGIALDLFYGSGRFSEDLDFDCKGLGKLTEIDEAIEALDSDGTHKVVNDWYAQRDTQRGFARYYLKVEAAGSEKLAELVIDCSMVKPDYPPSDFPLAYDNSIVNVKVMRADEIAAEKVSALLTREKARDLYDLYFLTVVKHIQINAKDVYAKCARRFSSEEPVPYSYKALEHRIGQLKGKWVELEPQVAAPKAYRFEDISNAVLDAFKGV